MNSPTSWPNRQQPWLRVSKDKPCPVCGKPNWCLVAHDGSATICPRTPEGAKKRCGEAGWLHLHRDRENWRQPRAMCFKIRPRVPSAEQAKMAGLAEQFRDAVDPERLERHARTLRLSIPSLCRLGIGWRKESNAWSFPMSDAEGRVLGIRLRTGDGKRKFTVIGGHEGLFLPEEFDGSGRLLIAEGPTDTAALLDLGFEAVGRPSCAGGAALLTDLVRRRRPAEVVIVADGDNPGQDGALRLVQQLVIHVPLLRIVTPPPGIKDARAWLIAGATHESITGAILAAQVHRATVRDEEERHGS